MNREHVLALLRSHRAELSAMGIRSLSLFGSAARDELRPDSDIDLLVEMDPPLTLRRYMHAKFYLEDIFQRPVDLVMPDTIKPLARPEIEKEAIHVA
jgi:predicted nucleotidyltransferase